MIVCGTGHRPDKLSGDFSMKGHALLTRVAERALAQVMNTDLFEPVERVITGGALGWDMALAEAAHALGLRTAVYVPCHGQDARWSVDHRRLYRSILGYAEDVKIGRHTQYSAAAMHSRNRDMVDDADIVLALWNGENTGGTYSTIRYAYRMNRPVRNVWYMYLEEKDRAA